MENEYVTEVNLFFKYSLLVKLIYIITLLMFYWLSAQFSRSVVSDSLQLHELQHARPPCPSPTPGVHPNSRPVMPSSHLILCCPLVLLPPIPPSIRVFSNESTLRMRWPKYWSFSFSIIPSKVISFNNWNIFSVKFFREFEWNMEKVR